VTVHLGGWCPSEITPAVVSITLDGVALAKVDGILGSPCGAMTTRSEEWALASPPPGMHQVAIALAGVSRTINSGALVVAGVDQGSPIRAHAAASGQGMQGQAAVTSAAGDLVLSTVGQGHMIVAPADGAVVVYLANRSSSDTLDNVAASSAAGTAGTTTMGWTFAQDAADEWQSIATSVRAKR
jgi:hypothetical protein